MRTDIYPHKKIQGKQDRKQTVLKKIPPFLMQLVKKAGRSPRSVPLNFDYNGSNSFNNLTDNPDEEDEQ